MKKKSLSTIIKGLYYRTLHHFARHCFPSVIRVALHRMRGVSIGRNVLIGLDVTIDDDGPQRVRIDDNVFLTSGCMILTHQRNLSNYSKGKWVGDMPFMIAPVHIKSGAHIGIGAIILPGVTIGRGTIIGAGAVVNKDIPDYCVAVGSPARVIKEFKNA